MPLKDYYHILGIERDAKTEDVKVAYRKMALLFHPDVNKDEEANTQFVDINEAYRILSDKYRRYYYDYLLNYLEMSARIQQEQSDPRKYGTAYKYPGSPHKPEPQNVIDKKYSRVFTWLDNIMFYTLILIGCLAIIFSLKDLMSSHFVGMKGVTGIFFGITFTGLMIYGWIEFRKSRKE